MLPLAPRAVTSFGNNFTNLSYASTFHSRAIDKRKTETDNARPTQHPAAQVVKLVDTPASGAGPRKGVEVQVLSWAPYLEKPTIKIRTATKMAHFGFFVNIGLTRLRV